jgi:hypothetical protein
VRDVDEDAEPVARSHDRLAERREPVVHRALSRDVTQVGDAVVHELKMRETHGAGGFEAAQVAFDEVAALRGKHDAGLRAADHPLQRRGIDDLDQVLRLVLAAQARKNRIETAGELAGAGFPHLLDAFSRDAPDHRSVGDDLAHDDEHAVFCHRLAHVGRSAEEADVAVHVGIAGARALRCDRGHTQMCCEQRCRRAEKASSVHRPPPLELAP